MVALGEDAVSYERGTPVALPTSSAPPEEGENLYRTYDVGP